MHNIQSFGEQSSQKRYKQQIRRYKYVSNMRQKEALHLPADGSIPKQKTENTAQNSNVEFRLEG
jgi:competence protein ComGC